MEAVVIFVSRHNGLLQNRAFRNLFIATTVSAASVSVARIAIPLSAVLALSASGFEVGLVSAFLTLPFLLVGLPAGVWVDRVRRRSVLIISQLARALVLFSIPLSWWTGTLTIWQLYAAVILFGTCNVFYDVAYHSFLPQVAGREKLLEANSRITGVQQVFEVGGPSFGGQLVALLTAPISFVVTSVGLAISSWCVVRIDVVEEAPAREEKSRMIPEVAAGLRMVRNDSRLLAIAGSSAWLNLTGYAIYTATMLFLARTLELSPGWIGAFFSIGGLGGLLGALAANRLSRALGHGRVMWLILLVGCPFSLLLPMVGSSWTLWLGACTNGVVTLTSVVYNVAQLSFCQAVTPDHLLGRMNATMRFLTWSVMPIGSILGGMVAGWLGPREGLFACAAASCVAFIPLLFSPLRGMRDLSPSVPDGEVRGESDRDSVLGN
ncbi:MFS transporter [Streptomyces sp. NPDC087228]|uniref:MFS transporter n=1 Tax=unclassified Streptomyces TaxID=2593676 RepID=UPI0037FD344B